VQRYSLVVGEGAIGPNRARAVVADDRVRRLPVAGGRAESPGRCLMSAAETG
jgi:hypothetical protein